MPSTPTSARSRASASHVDPDRLATDAIVPATDDLEREGPERKPGGTVGIQRIDLVNLRLFDEHDAEGRLAEQSGTLQDLRHEGKLELIGISNATADTVRRALELVDIACVQNACSVVNLADEDGLVLCEERAIAFLPFFPLGSAFSGGPRQLAADPVIAEVAVGRQATPSQIALAWLLHRSERIPLTRHQLDRAP